jgi:hypothetical protein
MVWDRTVRIPEGRSAEKEWTFPLPGGNGADIPLISELFINVL